MTLQKNAHYTNTYYQSQCNNAKAGYECDQKVMLYYLAVVVTNCTILKISKTFLKEKKKTEQQIS